MNRKLVLLVAFGALPVLPSRVSAQSPDRDVELLGRIYGTRPPQAYFELRENDPGAFRLERTPMAVSGSPQWRIRAAEPDASH